MIERSCLFHLRPPSSLSSSISCDSSFSSDNCYITAVPRTPPVVLRELIVRDLDDRSSTTFHCQRRIQREPFRIPRPILTVPRPIIRVPTNETLWTSYARPIRIQSRSRSPSILSTTYHTERAFYQNVPIAPSPPPPPLPPTPPPRAPTVPTIYQIGTRSPFPQYFPVPVTLPKRKTRYVREKPPGLFTTLATGGFHSIAALIYICFLLALPITKLVLGIIYVKDCPINKKIPVYIIISGACGLAIIIFLLFSSACNYCRAIIIAKKSTHRSMICTIALSRGMKGALAIFLFFWFFFGNAWILGVRSNVQTTRPSDTNTYCHPTLYWFGFYVLIFTYVYVVFTFCVKCLTNCCCCGAFDIWHKAFS